MLLRCPGANKGILDSVAEFWGLVKMANRDHLCYTLSPLRAEMIRGSSVYSK